MRYLFVTAFFIVFASRGQSLEYARRVVNTLASDEYKGRGYVDRGERKAADFIAAEFSEIGLKSFKKDYYQYFSTSVNSFPGQMELQLGTEQITPGVDFLIDPGSPGLSGMYKTVWLSADDINDGKVLGDKLRSSAGKMIVIPPFDKKHYSKEQNKLISDLTQYLRYHPNSPAVGVIVLRHDKLTWGGATQVSAKPSFTVKVDSSFQRFETVNIDIENEYHKKYKTQNVIGYIEGERDDSLMVYSAHYDHLGMMGQEAIFPGANDNASGVAMLLGLAKHHADNKPKFNTVFIAFGGEEIGLVGAKHFVDHPLFELSKVKFLLNFDISGTGDDGIQVVNGKVHRDEYDLLERINSEHNYLKQVKIRGEACNSDHCMFHMKSVPCFFIYTLGGIQAYHDVFDRAETLPLTKYLDYFKLMTEFIDQL